MAPRGLHPRLSGDPNCLVTWVELNKAVDCLNNVTRRSIILREIDETHSASKTREEICLIGGKDLDRGASESKQSLIVIANDNQASSGCHGIRRELEVNLFLKGICILIF